MMDYNASITYTLPVTPNVERAPSRPTTKAGSSGCSARCAGAPTPAARATARSTRSSSTSEHEVDLPQRGTSPTTRSSRRCSTRARPRPSRSPGCTCWLDGTDVVLGYQTAARHSQRRRPHRHAGRRGVGVGSREAPTAPRTAEGSLVGWMPTGEPDVDRPRPRGQDPVMPQRRRHRAHRLVDLADGAQHRQDRSPVLLEVITDAVERRRHHPRATSTSRARGAATTSPARRSRSCRTSTPSARGRRLATRTSRWTARGRCTRRGSGCSSATSTSRWRSARVARRPPTPRSIYPMEMDPYYLAPLGADPVSLRRAPGAGAARRGQGHRARHGRGRGAQPARRARATRTRR